MASPYRWLKDVPRRVRQDFKRLLGLDLADYWDVVGLDVIKLDDDLKVPEGKSTSQVVRERFGDDAVTLINHLFGKAAWPPEEKTKIAS